MKIYATPLLPLLTQFAAFCFASLAYAQSGALPPLSPTEFAAVIQEIKAMVKTDESQVSNFPVREATPARIERLYQMPELIQQPENIRENGLIFAGQGSLLKFEKPSDIITRISSWFPKEISAAQSKSDGLNRLWGPFPNWQDEPAAFLTLWKCMPRIAWLKPSQNPFARRLNDGGNNFMAIASQSSGEIDFGVCIHEGTRRRHVWTEEELSISKKEAREIGNRVAPMLRKKFASFLASNRCQGTGPDDCVLILLLWSSLSPEDVNLAQAIQALESEVAPDGPLPALQKAADQYQPGAKEGEARFDAALRKAAFLRAKLTSIASNPSAWPPQALATMLDQMSRFRLMFDAALKQGWNYYALDYYNEPVNPWYALSLNVGKTPRVRAAVLAHLDSLANQASCDAIAAWTKDQALRATFALQRLTDQPRLWCIGPDWNWLKQGETQEARELRQRYLGLLGQIESGAVHETLLSEFTDYGKNCFEQEGAPSPDWQREVCKKWITEPQTAQFTLKHSRLTLNDATQFHATPLQLPPASDTAPPDIAAWLTKLVQGMNDAAQKKMQAFIDDLKRRKGSVHTATWWNHPRHSKSLVELQLYINNEPSHPVWPYTGSRMLLVFEAQTLTLVGVPQRFSGQHDYGKIVHVSDLDEDGNLEVWWAEAFRQCQGDDSDLEREMDCSAKMADMGEIKGDSLTYFSNTLRTKHQPDIHKTLPANAALMATAIPENSLDVQRPCNAMLIGSILGDSLGISFRERAHDGEVIDLVCKPHPLHSERTIVALFHDLKDKPDTAVAEDKKEFVLAVIDAKQRKLYSLYRDAIGEDATTRISQFSLQLDTARYNLAPGVRALGVRMNIGYGPRCAEGGENNYLSLFIEEGAQLKPVLKDLPMSMWTITQGSNGCGSSDAAYTMDSVALTLTVSSSVTNGWRDLEVTAQHQIEAGEGTDMVKQQPKAQVLGKLRANGKMYSADYGWVRSRLWPER